MYYSYATMQRYKDAQNHDSKPYWCVVIEHEDSQIREYLTEPSLQNLTKEEAREKADELDIKFRRGELAATN